MINISRSLLLSLTPPTPTLLFLRTRLLVHSNSLSLNKKSAKPMIQSEPKMFVIFWWHQQNNTEKCAQVKLMRKATHAMSLRNVQDELEIKNPNRVYT